MLIFYIHIFIVKDYNSGVTKCLMLVFNSSSLSTGLKQSPQMPLAHSVLLTEIMDEIRRQVGVVFNQDRHWRDSRAKLFHLTQTCSGGSGHSWSVQTLDFWLTQMTQTTKPELHKWFLFQGLLNYTINKLFHINIWKALTSGIEGFFSLCTIYVSLYLQSE